MQVEDVKLLWIPEQDAHGLSLGSAVSCCTAGDSLQCRKWLSIRVM